MIRQAKQIYHDKVNAELSNPLTNIKKWWSISKNLCGKTYKSRIPTLIENDLITNPSKKACIFNDYFVSQTQLPGAGPSVVPNLPFYQSVTFLANSCATEDEVLILMRSVDILKASGSDGIGNKMIKFCSESLYLFFTKFVNFSFALGQYPTAWKMANVPIFKKGNSQWKVNY